LELNIVNLSDLSRQPVHSTQSSVDCLGWPPRRLGAARLSLCVPRHGSANPAPRRIGPQAMLTAQLPIPLHPAVKGQPPGGRARKQLA
jgi:hypothetical protein